MNKSMIFQRPYYFSFFLSLPFEHLSLNVMEGKQKLKLCSRRIFPFLLFFLSKFNVCHGQKETYAPVSAPISDSLISREMAFFTIAGTLQNKPNSELGIIMQKIPLTYSDGVFITFAEGDWIATKWRITISTESLDISKHKITYSDKQDSNIMAIDDQSFFGVSNSLPRSKVKEIGFFYFKGYHTLPESAFDGIFEPSIYYCLSKKDRKKPQNYFKAYRSEDNKRLYIYMLNGEGKDRYEVTWVMNNLEYYGRYINKVPN